LEGGVLGWGVDDVRSYVYTLKEERLWIHVDSGARKRLKYLGRGRNMHEEVEEVGLCD
jgi:hypothetical protein